MSLADLRWLRWRKNNRTWDGLAPPPASPLQLWDDLRWHAALYREDGVPRRQVAGFLGLRLVQRIAYNAGWHAGGAR